MPSPQWTRAVITVAAALWLGIAWSLGAAVDATWAKPAGFVVTAVVLLLIAFDTIAWRWLPFKLTKRPNIRGTWATDLHFTWPPESAPRTKRCYLVIHQTFSTVSVRMYLDTSSSESRSADIRRRDGQHSLWWVYLSQATEFDRDNPAHRGASELVIATVPRPSLDGIYWTERKTTGRLVTVGWSKSLFDSFAAADAAE
jgi:hypothetical protein